MRRPRLSVPKALLFLCVVFTGLGLLFLNLGFVDPPIRLPFSVQPEVQLRHSSNSSETQPVNNRTLPSACATVEEMGATAAAAAGGASREESLRVRRLIQEHFALQGASRVRSLPPEQFCQQGFVLGKASEAGLGNEMYKILTAAGLSIMLNRSLIIGQTRHIGSFSCHFCFDILVAPFICSNYCSSSIVLRGKFPFEDYISYTNLSFTLKEVKHLWRKNDCVGKYKRRLVMRTDDFEKLAESNVLCSNWMKWQQPIIWFQGTTDAVAAQFFLKNVHPQMRSSASALFGTTESLQSRPNLFGELLRVIISPSVNVEEAVNWALNGGPDPHLALHMRMLMNRSIRAVSAVLNCIRNALLINHNQLSRPRVVLVSDTPSLLSDITPKLEEFAEVIHFDYKLFEGNISGRKANEVQDLGFRAKDWGPAPRWVAFVDFFLASRAQHAVVSGAQRRVGTTYAQLIAALAAAHQLSEDHSQPSNFSFFSSFQSNLLSEGLQNQVGWGHVWNRFAGPLSCHSQPNQCALTPLLPPGWWDGILQSPIPRDIRRMEAFGVRLSGLGTVDENYLQSFCKSRTDIVKTIPVTRTCTGLTCT
ncbi:hypothetical protein RJ639_004384 [Escallonia herrerae]|uniref:Uncharacterized protein n=1 Tax=Escallonia herrerae TaxID=1293975 RepID=A0AA88W285_9ASTE|nr:hypothetical protein RJ639_004384 [Escallonia herrerae]